LKYGIDIIFCYVRWYISKFVMAPLVFLVKYTAELLVDVGIFLPFHVRCRDFFRMCRTVSILIPISAVTCGGAVCPCVTT
jgi:hypothetical protein